MHQIGSPFGRVFGLKAILSFSVSTLVLTKYAVAGFEPPLVLDFIEDYYRTGGSASTFDDALNFSRAGNATMVDSDGLLKWAPHNFVLQSVDFTSPVWGTTNLTWTTGVTDADGGATAFTATADVLGSFMEIRQLITGTANTYETIKVRYRALSISSVTFRLRDAASISNRVDLIVALDTGTVSSVTAFGTYTDASGTIENLGAGWYEVAARVKVGANTALRLDTVVNSGSVVSTGDFSLYYPHAYRSDLGGMVNNPDRGDSYVPTTTAARFLPRRGHHVWDGTEWVKEGMLVEPTAATNLITYSEDFMNGSWIKFQASVSDNVAISPDGATNADKIVESTDSGGHQISTSHTLSATTTYSHSFFAKAEERSRVRAIITDGGSLSSEVVFDLSSGGSVFTETGNFSAHVEDFGNGWVRCTQVFTTDTGASVTARIRLDDGTSASYIGDGVSGLYFWGAQLETGSVPTIYIPTAGATATRAADIVTVPAANLPYDATNMSIQMDGLTTYLEGSGVYFFVKWQNSSNGDYIQIDLRPDITAQYVFGQRQGGFLDKAISAPNYFVFGINVPFNLASRHGSTFLNGAVDGVSLTANLTPTALPDLSTSDLQLASSGGPVIISKLRIWADDLTDVGIAEASA